MMLECKELFYIQLSNKNSSGHILKLYQHTMITQSLNELGHND